MIILDIESKVPKIIKMKLLGLVIIRIEIYRQYVCSNKLPGINREFKQNCITYYKGFKFRKWYNMFYIVIIRDIQFYFQAIEINIADILERNTKFHHFPYLKCIFSIKENC